VASSELPSPNNRQRITDNRAKGASAFTLIEMTVVILIIATLAALLVTASSGVFDRARKVQAKNDVTQIVTAINAYYTEYGRYPVNITNPANDAFFGTGATPAGCTPYGTNDVLLDVLRSRIASALNDRQIVFLSPGGAKNTVPPKGGIAADNGYYDPWGSQYAIVIDTNYDNTISNPYSDSTNPIRQGVIAYSYGKNGALGGGPKLNASFGDESGTPGTFKSSSDILSW
jgi:prepilin-type N-terminal cleavage/methylation domain-containing protein